MEYPQRDGTFRAVDRVSFTVAPGETLTIVGESGCGKTTIARAILGLQPIAGGSISIKGRPINGPYRGMTEDVGMVWQDPNASLDPRWTLRRSIEEPAALASKAIDASDLLLKVGLSADHADRFPHQLSGGQRQRAAIARALALKPPIVICDEPTAALDLSIQAQILNLLKDLQEEMGCALVYISHDLGTVRYLADRILVMYLGQIVEQGEAESIFAAPRHPYTRALLDSAPTIDTIGIIPKGLSGEIGGGGDTLSGCRFAPRCHIAQNRCIMDEPSAEKDDPHQAICHFPLSLG
ncbi:MAG: putative D,D-dipeptide transport ATP-binding protein DdpF [Fimbriimonadaceae bacterium]|nr:putative D,D-dipeptide transport ATP-binding protein DdpF [Fimbriimonadaceae bacterium]